MREKWRVGDLERLRIDNGCLGGNSCAVGPSRLYAPTPTPKATPSEETPTLFFTTEFISYDTTPNRSRPLATSTCHQMDVHQLILTIQKRSCLWNVADKNHFNRDLMHKHWLEVAQEMDSTYDIVKKKWKGLKDVFRKELKKMNASKVPSSWSHFQDMEFMKDQMSPRELPVPIETLFKTEMVEEGEDSNYQPGYILRNSLLGIDTTVRSRDGEVTTSDDGDDTTQPDSNTRPRGVKRRYVEEDLPSYTFAMPDDLHKDDDYNFLVSFLPYLKNMSPRKKLLYRMKLCQLLYETAYSDEN